MKKITLDQEYALLKVVYAEAIKAHDLAMSEKDCDAATIYLERAKASTKRQTEIVRIKRQALNEIKNRGGSHKTDK